MSNTWPDGSATGYEASEIGPLLTRETMGWYDPRYYGAKFDLRRVTATSTASSGNLTGTYLANNGDAGKRAYMFGSGPILAQASDGVVAVSPTTDRNILVSAGASFDNSLVGRRITITGVGVAGATLTSRVWGVISPTQLRIINNATTAASSQTYTISDDLYATVTASSTAGISLDTAPSVSITAGGLYVTTDDAPHVNTTINGALAESPRASQGIPPTVFLPGAFGIGSTLSVEALNCRMRLLGTGLQGFSLLLAQGSTLIRAVSPGLDAFIRFANGGPGSGLGLRGSITSGTNTLTCLDGSWTIADVGKKISVVGAGTQQGSTTQIALRTTITGFISATQVTLLANAGTTVSEAIYSWAGANVSGVTNALSIERMHLMGAAGHNAGIHILAGADYELANVTASDFHGGLGHYADGITGNTQNQNIMNCKFTNCRIGVKLQNTNVASMSGVNIIDGNNNQVGVMPPADVIGLDVSGVLATGTTIIQASGIGFRCDGDADGHSLLDCARFEANAIGIQLAGNGTTIGQGNIIKCPAWSTSGIGGLNRSGLVLLAGVTNTEFTPGYYLTTNINMYGDSDPTALATCFAHDPNVHTPQSPAYTASYAPDLAAGEIIDMTLTGNISIIAPTNLTAGLIITFNFLQDITGSRTMTFDPAVYSTSWTPTTTPGTLNSISFRTNGTKFIQFGSALVL